MTPLLMPDEPADVTGPRSRLRASDRKPQRRWGAWLGLGVAATVALTALGGVTPAPVRAADTCANAQFRTGSSAQLPDCRAYEMVTLADKAGLSPDAADLSVSQSPTSLVGSYLSYVFGAVGGDAFYMTSRGAFAGAQGPHHSNVVTVRTASGWQGASSSPPPCTHDASGIFNGANIAALSQDFSLAAYGYSSSGGNVSADCDADDHGGGDIYTVARVGTSAWGPPVWASRGTEPKTTDDAAAFAGLSADGTHVLFTTPEKLLPVDAAREVGSGLYDRVGGRTLAVGLNSDGTPVNACGASFPVGVGTPDSSAPWPIAADGRVIAFYAGASTTAADPACSPTTGNGNQLFVRIDGVKTVQISRSQLANPEAQARPTFIGATPDGRHIFFRSTERLIPGAATGGGQPGIGDGLYEYDLSPVLDDGAAAGTLRFLSPSLDGNPVGVTRLIGVTDDASVVTFVASGVLVPGAPATGKKIYQVRDGGAPTLVAAPHQALVDLNTVNVSPDGSYVAYLDVASAPGSVQQVYLVDARDPGSPTCVSCPASGTAPAGPATFANASSATWPRTFGRNPFVTDDARVFFGSSDQLVRQDANAAWDVYEYRDGTRTLLTPGTGANDALLMGMGPDGRDVFFATAASLLAQDFDNGDIDVYDARSGGGFAQPTREVECAGDECQPQGSVPGLAVPGTVAFAAPFSVRTNVAPITSRAKKVSVKRPKTVVGKTRAQLLVKAPTAGLIRVSGSGLKRAKKSAKSAKTYRVTVKLSARSKRILRRRHRVTVRVSVRFTPKHGKRSRAQSHVTFRAKKDHGDGSRRSRDRVHSTSRKDGR